MLRRLSISSSSSFRDRDNRLTSTESLLTLDDRMMKKSRKHDSPARSYCFPNGEVFTPRTAPAKRNKPKVIPRLRSMVLVSTLSTMSANRMHADGSITNDINTHMVTHNTSMNSNISMNTGMGSMPYYAKVKSKKDLVLQIRSNKLDTCTNINITDLATPATLQPFKPRLFSLINNKYAENLTNIVRLELLATLDRAGGPDLTPSSLSNYNLMRLNLNTPQTSVSDNEEEIHMVSSISSPKCSMSSIGTTNVRSGNVSGSMGGNANNNIGNYTKDEATYKMKPLGPIREFIPGTVENTNTKNTLHGHDSIVQIAQEQILCDDNVLDMGKQEIQHNVLTGAQSNVDQSDLHLSKIKYSLHSRSLSLRPNGQSPSRSIDQPLDVSLVESQMYTSTTESPESAVDTSVPTFDDDASHNSEYTANTTQSAEPECKTVLDFRQPITILESKGTKTYAMEPASTNTSSDFVTTPTDVTSEELTEVPESINGMSDFGDLTSDLHVTRSIPSVQSSPSVLSAHSSNTNSLAPLSMRQLGSLQRQALRLQHATVSLLPVGLRSPDNGSTNAEREPNLDSIDATPKQSTTEQANPDKFAESMKISEQVIPLAASSVIDNNENVNILKADSTRDESSKEDSMKVENMDTSKQLSNKATDVSNVHKDASKTIADELGDAVTNQPLKPDELGDTITNQALRSDDLKQTNHEFSKRRNIGLLLNVDAESLLSVTDLSTEGPTLHSKDSIKVMSDNEVNASADSKLVVSEVRTPTNPTHPVTRTPASEFSFNNGEDSIKVRPSTPVVNVSEWYSQGQIDKFLADDQDEVPPRGDLDFSGANIKTDKSNTLSNGSEETTLPERSHKRDFSPSEKLNQDLEESNPKPQINHKPSMLDVLDMDEVDFNISLPPSPEKKVRQADFYSLLSDHLDSPLQFVPNTSDPFPGIKIEETVHAPATKSMRKSSSIANFKKAFKIFGSSKDSLKDKKLTDKPLIGSLKNSHASSDKPVTRRQVRGPLIQSNASQESLASTSSKSAKSKRKKFALNLKLSTATPIEEVQSPVYSVRERPLTPEVPPLKREPSSTFNLPSFEVENDMFDDILMKFDEVEKEAEIEVEKKLNNLKSLSDFFLKDDELTRAQIADQQKNDIQLSDESLPRKFPPDVQSPDMSGEEWSALEDKFSQLKCDKLIVDLPADQGEHRLVVKKDALVQLLSGDTHRMPTYLKHVKQFVDFDEIEITMTDFDPACHEELVPAGPAISPILKSGEANANGRSVKFSNTISISETYPPYMYKRYNKSVTQYYLTEFTEVNRIKNELNAYKCHEMLVHEKSQMNTHFFY